VSCQRVQFRVEPAEGMSWLACIWHTFGKELPSQMLWRAQGSHQGATPETLDSAHSSGPIDRVGLASWHETRSKKVIIQWGAAVGLTVNQSAPRGGMNCWLRAVDNDCSDCHLFTIIGEFHTPTCREKHFMRDLTRENYPGWLAGLLCWIIILNLIWPPLE